MGDLLRVACVQLSSGTDKAANLEKAEALVARAASTGADVVLLPEKWNAIGSADTLRANAEPLEGGESVEARRLLSQTRSLGPFARMSITIRRASHSCGGAAQRAA